MRIIAAEFNDLLIGGQHTDVDTLDGNLRIRPAWGKPPPAIHADTIVDTLPVEGPGLAVRTCLDNDRHSRHVETRR